MICGICRLRSVTNHNCTCCDRCLLATGASLHDARRKLMYLMKTGKVVIK